MVTYVKGSLTGLPLPPFRFTGKVSRDIPIVVNFAAIHLIGTSHTWGSTSNPRVIGILHRF